MPKPPGEIYQEWERLVFHTEPYPTVNREPPPELVDGFRALYAKTWSGSEWLCEFNDAESVASLGYNTSFRQKQFGDAARHLRELRQHPDWLPSCMNTLEVWWGCAELLSGEVPAGIALWDSVLQVEGYGRVTRLRLLLGSILSVVEEAEDLTSLLPALKDFLSRLVATHAKFKSMAGLVGGIETRDDLVQAAERALKRLN